MGRSEDVGEGREQESLDAFWEGLMAEQLAGVEAIAMDMWKPYVQSTLAHVPGAAGKIVHDPFHLVKYMNEAVNEVRKSEHRRLQAQGDDILKSTRQLWLYGMENVPAKHAQRFDADQARPHRLGSQIRRLPLGREHQVTAVLHDEFQTRHALRRAPTDPPIPILERVTTGDPRPRSATNWRRSSTPVRPAPRKW